MNNTKFNIIFGLIGIVLLVILINVFYIYRRNEKSKISFNITDINNANWINDDASLDLRNNRLIFIIDGETIINNKTYSVDNRTGKFVIDGDDTELYLRSVMKDSIIVWYKKQEFNLKKEVIAR
ncbi:MAG: hypothetical protein J1F35_04215 [Erysipelotrichales bacterium]|nr:hypothetical protein [Erysipelotrichales bacterium]